MNKHELDKLPLNVFLQTKHYANLRYNLNREVNHNSVNYNIELKNTKISSNLIVKDLESLTNTKEEKIKLKKARKEYKEYINTLHGESEKSKILKTFVDNINNRLSANITKFYC